MFCVHCGHHPHHHVSLAEKDADQEAIDDLKKQLESESNPDMKALIKSRLDILKKEVNVAQEFERQLTKSTQKLQDTIAKIIKQGRGQILLNMTPTELKNFLISGINTDVSLTNQANNIGILAARIASLNLITADGIDLGDAYGKGLYVDTVGGISGITASGTISLSSRYSNIYIKQNISTTDISNYAIKLNAGEALAPGPSKIGRAHV